MLLVNPKILWGEGQRGFPILGDGERIRDLFGVMWGRRSRAKREAEQGSLSMGNLLDPREPPGSWEDLLDPGKTFQTLRESPKPWENLLVSTEISWSLGDPPGSSVVLLVPGKAQLLKGKQQKSPLCKVNTKHIPLEFSKGFFFLLKYPILSKTAHLGSNLNYLLVRWLSCHFASKDAPSAWRGGLERSWVLFV